MNYEELVEKVRRMGPWTGVRWMRNKGVDFNLAHVVILGCFPRYWEIPL